MVRQIPHLIFAAIVVFESTLLQADSPTSVNVPIANAPASATNSAASSPLKTAQVATLSVADLREYEMQPAPVQQLIASALKLTTLNLTYQYGSSDPSNGGMDCSGTVYYLLKAAGLKDVPRNASGMYKWIWLHSRFQAVTSSNPNTFELGPLKPGDLLFWTGTYQVDRDPPVTHVMIYLGINRHTDRRVMVGASEGRRFNDTSRFGVSVFDFVLPGARRAIDPATTTSRFIGYGAVPGLDAIAPAAVP